ncbi:hemocytin isoform X2 [Teleopsis dalmanni]|uniref:hemocytin isoform X2 n=1 Tax=Teleopsis dalmanni TaxID=139649 RepID=UPI0018CF67C3|nr:hemocytin isoform X2 [Teleopsis dalmanni]
MRKVKFIFLLVLIGYINADVGDSGDTDPLNPAAAEETVDNERNERSIFGFGKSKEVVVVPVVSTVDIKASGNRNYGGSSGYGNPGYSVSTGYGTPGIKTSIGGYGGSNPSGYSIQSSYHSSYGQPFGAVKQIPYSMNVRQMLPNFGACVAIPLPSNVHSECHGNQCQVTCPNAYTFPDGTKLLKINCIGGSWIIRDSKFTTVPSCQAVCVPPCQNNGICISAGVCKCSENFMGPFCQTKKSVCYGKPPIPSNSKVSCSNNVCNAECLRGFQFPDGSTDTKIECQGNQWIHTKSGLTKPPDCKPSCTPACANGGQCISANVCQCSKMYRGDHCQFSINECSVNKTNFNGEYKCSYDSKEAKCMFNCPKVPGLKVQGNLNIEYKCKYEVGAFYPTPIPKCIYPPGYTINKGKTSSHLVMHTGKTVSGGGGSGGYTYLTERERILAILAKFKEYDSRSEWWSSEENLVSSSSYSLYTTGDVNVVIDRAPKPAICTTWGGINIKTFDGLVFKAPLSCSHTLVMDSVDATFDVTLKACPYGSGYGCAHTLKINWQSVQYILESINGTLKLSTRTNVLPIPVQVVGMKVLPVAEHIQIHLESVGVKIDWDRHQYIAVHVSPILWSKVGGLCGSLDGDYRNDLMSKYGKVMETVKAFADSWRVEDKSDLCVMENSAELEFGSSKCASDKHQKAISICERLLANEKLGDCIKLFNFEALLKTCVDDYCNCPNREHPETCNCDAMSMLAKECVFKGVKLEHGWRNLEICPISCNYGRVYLPCGPDVESTCDSALEPTKGKCNEGCFCPEGTVQYKDACITPELCPCVIRGKEFKPEDVIKRDCNTCTCKNGKWKCSDEKCGARCGAIGDPHYQTFDGKRFDFMGKCSYYLLKTPNISIEAENVACSGVISENLNLAVTSDNPSCTKSVTLHFVLNNGVATTVKINQGFLTLVNNKEITKFPKILGANEVLIRHASSTFLTIDFPDGLRVWWDGVSRAYIDAPPSYRGRTAGLCGTFNSNTQDDFLTPEGDIETAVEPFADKWRTKDTCDFLTDTTTGPHPCTVNAEKRAEAEKYCAWITEDIFQECHWTVEPEQYYEDCLYDVCACKDELNKCFCPILSAYGAECMRQGIRTGWRMTIKECAVQCPVGQVYDECGDSCTRTCEDLATKNTCKRECVEGCRCPHGEYLNDENECVPQKKCPCTYDGMVFKPGYKEVRPGEKFLDLCTCENGIWECEDAEPGDQEKYPPSSELRAECANKPFAKFTNCVPKEPETCKNMHEYKEDLEDCTPGCVCMQGYVYDTTRKVCVLPENCSCHHGGKSYNDGETIREDCNTCVCQSGNWKCSSNGCESTCSVWGDSHFTTFDNHDFDFQGACDYVLSKGVNDHGDGYTITIQNVLCGTMGVTCSKSVEISLSGSVEDTITLTSDSTYMENPNKSAIKKLRDAVNAKAQGAFHIYKAGVFVVVEVISLKLQIKWDEGTRVYVKLGNEWKNKVNGLCGNYNDNAMDDMKTPSLGLETSPLIFGHAWKVQKFCAVPTQPIDACKEHPERETWAQLKCGVLKSAMFKDCHAEVPVDKFMKRCIFDSCACDQGGDCECLCTAIAAYAHSCSQKGINIRWRTPHFCPMQCDPHCAEYKSCTPSCALETCDNFLDQGIAERMCNKENCIEGCYIKPCEEGMIYLNDTYKECVPKSECKPVCMVKDEITYYEGDVTYQDACATCRCSKKKEVCSGVKCEKELTTNLPIIDGTTEKPICTENQTKCVRGWTRWYDKDADSSNKTTRLNDEEKLPRYDRLEKIYSSCEKKYMKKIECRVVNTHESSDYMDENVFCNLREGLACVGQCHDYEIRVFCECEEAETTTVAPTEKPLIGKVCDTLIAEYKEFPGDCHKFLHCQPSSVEGKWAYVEKTCGEFMMFNPTMNICDHIATVQGIKPTCGEPTPESLKEQKCPDGTEMSDCANQCEHTCHHYGMILTKRGLCKKGEHCKPGCVDKNRPNCRGERKYWRDENTCVNADECPCMDKNEDYVKPHMPVIGEWEVCQCIDNAYTCVPNKIEQTTKTPLTKNNTVYPEIEYVTVPNTVTPPLHCAPDRLKVMIQADEPLPDTVFNASSSLGPNYAPYKARLYKNPQEKTGSWSPNINDQMQYLQVTFEEPEPIFGVIMAGSPDFDNYVTLFKILYSYDGEVYHYLSDENDKPQMFNGPLDSREPVQTLFKIPVEAKSVHIYPLKWHGSIAMRIELLGCRTHLETTLKIESTTLSYVEATTTPPVEFEKYTECIDKMGLENGQMSPNQVKASSTLQFLQLPNNAKKPKLIDLLKLSSPVSWKPVANTPNEYVEFDFLEPRNISGFITKGGSDGWVSGFKVLFSKNKKIWNKVLAVDGTARIFPGNHDSDSEKTNFFKTPILTQYLKVVPAKWEKNINLRIEPLGCFHPYLELEKKATILDRPHNKCQVCDGIIDSTGNDEECKCKDGLFWDGSICVNQNLCPCVENYITYPIGSKFENKVCEECVCLLGGHANCKSKKCPPCEKNLRPIMGTGCFCKCEPCPKYQKLCPSSGDCIPELLWCNGVQDCADDEDDTCTKKIPPTDGTQKNETVVITCPEPVCPPQMQIKITEKKARKMSEMFTSTYSKKFTMINDGNKITKTSVVTKTQEFLPMPSDSVDMVKEEICAEFTCIPIQIIDKNVSVTCMEPKCPNNYDIELDMSNAKPGDCQKYLCVLRPRKDDTCQISGKSFTTFDGTEFKYDTCSHILARDLVNSSWVISVQLHCTDKTRKVCRKMVTIKDATAPAILTILPNMKLNFNGFEYSVQQLISSPICKASFDISQLGNTVLVVSRKHGFWVRYDDIGYIEIGVSSKYIKTVDGLCGYYNGISSDDKRAPDGTIMPTSVKFGDSWFDKQISKEECYPQVCPMDLQRKALALCNTIKHPTFVKCGKSVNSKQFVSKCMETTCECLKTEGDASACKCKILQDFVKKCLTVNPNVQLSTWRAVHQCETSCPAPLVHTDCYKRRCEPSCSSLGNDECPVLPDACFAGCYCPEGTVRKGKDCVPIVECKDCICNSFGTSKYFTYDRKSFTFNGNCTYLLSRDIVLPGVHTFQVYVTMDECKKVGITSLPEHTSCAKSLHVLNGDHVIHIQRVPNKPLVLQVFIDGFEIKKLPYKDSWINLREVNGKELVLTLPESHTELTAAMEDLVFSIGVPSVKYGGKMEGLCGDCNGNPDNDLQQNPAKKKKGKPSKDLVDVIKSWQADEPKLGLENNECLSEDVPKQDCIPLPPEKDPCMLLLNEDIFGKCSMIVDPLVYVSTCQQDMCKPGNNQKGACDMLSAYAKECAKHKVCVNWRRPDFCPYECPADMLYEPCGCAKTCDTVKKLSEFDAVNINTNEVIETVTMEDVCATQGRFEGCFCPPGKVLDKGKCIEQKMCVKCDDLIHMPGDKWQKDKCTDCSCDKSGKTLCVEQKCLVEENICAEGYKPQKIVVDEQCCPRYACVPEPKVPPSKLCLAPIMPICGPGQFKKQKTGPDGCPQYICECKPKEECDKLVPPKELQPGQKVVQEELGCCPTQKIVCDKTTCPEAPQTCTEKFFEVTKLEKPELCCPVYKCAPPKDICIVQYDSPEDSKFTKNVNEKWIHPHNACLHERCTYGPNGSTQILSTEETCNTSCPLGFTYKKMDSSKCCGECIQTECLFESKLHKPEEEWKSADNCTSYKCIQKEDMLIVNSFKETCPDVSKCPSHLLIDEGCCKYCKEEPVVENQKDCLAISLADTETRNLIKIRIANHGFCVNTEPIKGFTECVGTCFSGAKYNKNTFTHDKICNCCSIKSYKTIEVPLVCEDGFKIPKDLEIPSYCGCLPCSESVEYQTDPQIDIRLHPLPLAQLISNQNIKH